MRTRTRLYGPLSVLLGLLALAGAGLLPAGSAAAADNGTWGVFPTPPAGAAMTDRAYFFHQGAAGTAVADSVTLLNSSDRELTFRVFATDAVNTPAGGAFALLPVDQKPRDVGTWIQLPPETAQVVKVPPKGRKDVPFTVKVPEDAAPGDHVGGIVALGTEVEGVQQEGKVQVGVRRQVGARLYFRVPGPLTPAVSVEEVKVNRRAPLLPWLRDASATISYTLVNRGNVVVEPKVAVDARGLFGRQVLDRPARETKLVLLPGQRVRLTEPWPDAPQSDWVTVRLTATATAYPEVVSRAERDFVAVPWPAVGALLVLAGGAVGVRIVRRRRRAPREAEPAAGARDLAGTR
ncbi:WxL protein peptidoglycan domain-containing protein [Streptomyces sp. NPDC090022]|uniref:WxL protein peptidoglycan domain-containing protein n=1 Tax=Streptomyces sp. NPDC090022 TaxID=3365920 RepID=UPI0037F88DD8